MIGGQESLLFRQFRVVFRTRQGNIFDPVERPLQAAGSSGDQLVKVDAQTVDSATLTPDDLLAAMRRHIDLEKISIFRAGDFANNPPR